MKKHFLVLIIAGMVMIGSACSPEAFQYDKQEIALLSTEGTYLLGGVVEARLTQQAGYVVLTSAAADSVLVYAEVAHGRHERLFPYGEFTYRLPNHGHFFVKAYSHGHLIGGGHYVLLPPQKEPGQPSD